MTGLGGVIKRIMLCMNLVVVVLLVPDGHWPIGIVESSGSLSVTIKKPEKFLRVDRVRRRIGIRHCTVVDVYLRGNPHIRSALARCTECTPSQTI